MGLIVFLPLLLIMYFMILRPQQQRMKAQRELLSSLEPGDDVITAAGIYGTIVEFEGEGAWLEIAEGIEIKIVAGHDRASGAGAGRRAGFRRRAGVGRRRRRLIDWPPNPSLST